MSTHPDTSRSPLEASSLSKKIAAIIVIVYATIALIPMLLIVATAFKSTTDAITYPPKVIFKPSLEGIVNLATNRTRQSKEYLDSLPPPKAWYEKIVRKRQMVITGQSRFFHRFTNSLIIGFGATFFSVFLGTFAAYAFSRFKIPLKDDLLFFILSTRMFPPIAAAVPIFLMYRKLGLNDTHLGMIILYTVVNLSLSVWLLKGFMDEIPKEYEEAALVDGYSRLSAFFKIILPQAATGIAATAIFCLIFSWNEYAFAILLTFREAQTLPPFIPTIIGEGGLDWPAIAAATTIFMLPVIIFTIVLRKHLLRGITFGAVRK
ncbi:MAG: carbohydrate ABC transporter permease [Desulfobacula sp.]|uniref:carbohydrate ABC transporter permease n=1 Tax=Desulfobacula sp. TaxID=2593537 RepID=UPI0025BA897A|nr:carbohydrate ABC transporter permease [Desulfobacula sp.]MCD4719701.1 carbohydrate ABC transporter permease [Desulfobacula sp.]